MKPTTTGRHALEIRVLERVVVSKDFESKPGNTTYVFRNSFKLFTPETLTYYVIKGQWCTFCGFFFISVVKVNFDP